MTEKIKTKMFSASVTKVNSDCIYFVYYNPKTKSNSLVEIRHDIDPTTSHNIKVGDRLKVFQTLYWSNDVTTNHGTIGVIEALDRGFLILSKLKDKYSTTQLNPSYKEIIPLFNIKKKVSVGDVIQLFTKTSIQVR